MLPQPGFEPGPQDYPLGHEGYPGLIGLEDVFIPGSVFLPEFESVAVITNCPLCNVRNPYISPLESPVCNLLM